MKILGFEVPWGRKDSVVVAEPTDGGGVPEHLPEAPNNDDIRVTESQPRSGWMAGNGTGVYTTFRTAVWDGENELGGMGPVKHWELDHNALRARSWESYLKSPVCHTIMNKHTRWVIGRGLKLQAQPHYKVLEMMGVKVERNYFNDVVEPLYRNYASSRFSDYKEMDSSNKLQGEAYKNAIVGGDMLIVQRFIDGVPTKQHIDAAKICTPMDSGLQYDGMNYRYEPTGNIIRHGVEIDERGRHVAYHVRNTLMQWQRIAVRNPVTGGRQAGLVYGKKYRLDNVRGIPLLSIVNEMAKMLDRYGRAALGSAEERQKIILQVVHGINSTGTNPYQAGLTKAFDVDRNNTDVPVDRDGKALQNEVQATTGKTTVNMPRDSKLESIKSDQEAHVKEFYEIHIDIIAAAVGIPPNVAMSKYDTSFSSARAALMDWFHSLLCERSDFAEQYNQLEYEFWLDAMVVTGRIYLPGYMEAMKRNDKMLLSAYRGARWVGAPVPHIDPLKEVKAWRERLGPLGAHLPLGSLEMATEELNGGDYVSNLNAFANELELAEDLGLEEDKEPNALEIQQMKYIADRETDND